MLGPTPVDKWGVDNTIHRPAPGQEKAVNQQVGQFSEIAEQDAAGSKIRSLTQRLV